MSKIEKVFQNLIRKQQTALIPFLMAGDPNLEMFKALIWKITEIGADLIEIGIPYSDPIADGPTIQKAGQRALRQGVNLAQVLKTIEEFKGIPTPLIIMSYFNPIFCFGLRNFAHACQCSGISGVIIPDLPPEEAGPWVKEARLAGIDTIFLTSPTSPWPRIKKIMRLSRGFIYHISVTGVTGTREKLPLNMQTIIRQIKEVSSIPVAVGFGISTLEQAQEVKVIADGVIVGSALIKIIEETKNNEDLLSRMENFLRPLAALLHSSPGLSA